MDYILVNTATLSLLFFVCYSEAFNHTKFCVQNPNNTLCIIPGDEPGELCKDYESKKLGKSEKRGIILWHAKILGRHALNPESTTGVHWDSTLSAIAKRWSSRCNASQDMNRHFDDNRVSQHIFRVRGIDNSSYSALDVLRMSEYRVMDDESKNSDFVNQLREWNFFRMGCGMSVYTDGYGKSKNATAKLYELVCNYLPLGNVSKRLGERLEFKKIIPRSSNEFDKTSKKLEKNPKRSQSLWSREEIGERRLGGKFRGQYPKVRNKIPSGSEEDKEERDKSFEAQEDGQHESEEEEEDEQVGNEEEEEEEEEDEQVGNEEEEEGDGDEDSSRDIRYQYVNLGQRDYEDEYSENEEEPSAYVNELEKEIDRNIDEEFGPFKGFLISTEKHGNLSAVSIKMDLRLGKVFQEFEHAGARVTSKSKFVLWAIRDSSYGDVVKPGAYVLFACLIVLLISHVITKFFRF